MAVATFAAADAAPHAALGAAEAGASGASPAESLTATIVPYTVDRLFRSSRGTANAAAANDARAETALIFEADLAAGAVPPQDSAYLAQLVSSATGISQTDAQGRVEQAITDLQAATLRVRRAADEARKVSARASIFTAVSMLVGAFIACAAAALGGTWRDEYP